MVDIDESSARVQVEDLALIKVQNTVEPATNANDIYRVSWYINGSRRERFFKDKQHAENFKKEVEISAELIGLTLKDGVIVGRIDVY